jgi:hypothetical protein
VIPSLVYSLAQCCHVASRPGIAMKAQGIGAALSNLLVSAIVRLVGYSAGVITLLGIASVGLLICYVGLPEMRGCESLVMKDT